MGVYLVCLRKILPAVVVKMVIAPFTKNGRNDLRKSLIVMGLKKSTGCRNEHHAAALETSRKSNEDIPGVRPWTLDGLAGGNSTRTEEVRPDHRCLEGVKGGSPSRRVTVADGSPPG